MQDKKEKYVVRFVASLRLKEKQEDEFFHLPALAYNDAGEGAREEYCTREGAREE